MKSLRTFAPVVTAHSEGFFARTFLFFLSFTVQSNYSAIIRDHYQLRMDRISEKMKKTNKAKCRKITFLGIRPIHYGIPCKFAVS